MFTVEPAVLIEFAYNIYQSQDKCFATRWLNTYSQSVEHDVVLDEISEGMRSKFAR